MQTTDEKLVEVGSKTKSLLFTKLVQIVDERFYFKNEVTRDKVIHAIIESYREPQKIWITGEFASGKSTLARFIKNAGKNFMIVEMDFLSKVRPADLFSQEARGIIVVDASVYDVKRADPSQVIEMTMKPSSHELISSFECTQLPEFLKEELQTLFEIYTSGA